MNPLLEPFHKERKEKKKDRGRYRNTHTYTQTGSYFSDYAIIPDGKIHNLGQRLAPASMWPWSLADAGHLYPTTDRACEKEQEATQRL